MNLAELSIKRPVFITCLVALMLIVGVISYNRMSVDQFPDVSFPYITVQTIYKGASPVDIEKLISKPLEDELGSLGGLVNLKSINAESVSYVVLQFKIGSDVKDLENQVRQRVGNILRTLPSEAEQPSIRRIDPADQPITRLGVRSTLEPGKLFDVVDTIVKGKFETISGVGQVRIVGARKREIHVNVNLDKMQDRKISMLQIGERIKATSKDVPVGRIENGSKETTLRASGEFESVNSLKDVNVNFIGSDKVVKLSEIAEVKDDLVEELSEARISLKSDGFTPKPSLFVDVYKQSGANTVAVIEDVRINMPKVNAALQQAGVDAEVVFVRDGGVPIKNNIIDVRESIFIGIVLCIIVVFFFLGSGRSTFITGMALPNSLIGGFIIMYAMGFSINVLTLLALSLAVGLLIDDAIVVRENIFRHLEMGKNPVQAALDGTKEVSMAVIATTMVVIAVFGPVSFMDGIVGQFFRQFGLTVVFTMLISLFDAFTVAPMLSAYMATSAEHKKSTGFVGRLLKKFDDFQTKLEDKYEITIGWVLQNKIKVLSGAILVFFISLGTAGFIPKNFLPPADTAEFRISIEKPVGSSLGSTKEVTAKIETELKKNASIELLGTVIGSTTGQVDSTKADIYVHLVPRKERQFKTSEVKEQVREALKVFSQEAIVAVTDIDVTGGNMKPFNLNLSSDDLDSLATYASKLSERMNKIPGLVDIDMNYRIGKPEFHVNFDREKSEALGVSTATAGAELRARVEGLVPATFRENGKEYDIRIRLKDFDRDLRTKFETTRVPNTNFDMIPLTKVATGEEKLGYSMINRLNKSRYIQISANQGAGGNLGEIQKQVDNLLKEDPEFKSPSGIRYSYEGMVEDNKDMQVNMMKAMFLAVILIYLVLCSLYESFITPFTILLALPLAVVGALLALLITQKSLDIFSFIGLVMLLGVVAKNSILLVDYTGQLIHEGMERNAALIKACRTRLRPILMTSLALIFGTLPIAVGLNEASSQRTSMGVAIIGGLISSTLLTLVVVPSAYGYIDDFRIWLNRVITKLRGKGAAEIASIH